MLKALNQIYSQYSLGTKLSIETNAPLFSCYFAFVASFERPTILVTRSNEHYSDFIKNIRFFSNSYTNKIMGFPTDDRTPFHAAAVDPIISAKQVASAFKLSSAKIPPLLILPPNALLSRCPSAKNLKKYTQTLVKGSKINREELLSSLVMMGYTKVASVIDYGTFSVRGSIIDIFANGEKDPLRIDLFGDEIETLKYFNPESQRSTSNADTINIGPVRDIFLDSQGIACAEKKLIELADLLNFPTAKLNEKLREIELGHYFFGIEKLKPAFFDDWSSLLELYQENNEAKPPLIVFDRKSQVFDELHQYHEELIEMHQKAIARGDLVFAPEDYVLSINKLNDMLKSWQIVDIDHGLTKSDYVFLTKETAQLRQAILQETIVTSSDEAPHLLKPLASRIKEFHKEQSAVILVVSSRENEHKLKSMLSPFSLNLHNLTSLPLWQNESHDLFKPHIHSYIFVSKDTPSFGASFDFLRLAIISEEDIFGKRTKKKDQSGKQKGFSTSLSDLEPGDYVVHVDHGVGQFNGLKRLNLRGISNDYVMLCYANEEKLYLPVHRINLIKPYGITKEASVRLDKLGGTTWQTKKSKVKAAVIAMAQDLLKLYAKREVVERPPFLAPDNHFAEFEANFEFETTLDQQKAIDDVIADLQKNKPMDRLVCGDVGYGKTEVAMRAAMLAILSKRQVALLAPTTILAQQHGLTFTERFKNTGVNIAVVSRFQSAAEVKQILKDLACHRIDIVIGTHRLLSPDVEFSNLQLIIVDEEQRFGIKAKEHLKKMRTKVDVLTMSATPIPRTLQMSYFGIRDLSIIDTPPVDRRAIQTSIAQFDDALIKEAILREVSRGGQVYFVHNRVQNIEAIADYLKTLVPDLRISVAHGQMSESILEEKMLSFMKHEIDVLVCTTIIETGIDVPTANTMFINDADDFGLSQLYQLRGRIGRSKERAFAYLLIKGNTEQLSGIAKTRLEILHRFSELGAGFRIAQHDLELRGAGDLLGKNQHGHMAAVGYDLYADLLKEAISELKGRAHEDDIDPEIIVPISAMIPDTYCPDLHERMAFYQRLASAENKEDIEVLIAEMDDLYGQIPLELLALKEISILKLELKAIKAIKLEATKAENTNSSYSVGINLSPSSPINQNKILSWLNANKNVRITPQNKIIQSIPITEPNVHDAIFAACRVALELIRKNLLID